MSDRISDAVTVILDAARNAFDEPNGHPALYRFSVSPCGTKLEAMHGTRRPTEWREWPITIRNDANKNAGGT
jgi:hypothetical protein